MTKHDNFKTRLAECIGDRKFIRFPWTPAVRKWEQQLKERLKERNENANTGAN